MSLAIHYNVQGCFRPPGEDLALAKDAIDAGFGGIWIGDHFLPWLDSRPYTHHPFPWFGALLNEIPDVPVGTSVTCPTIRYRPPLLAQQIATLDNMYPGRFNLGIGVGEALNEAHFFDGEWPSWHVLADMMIESIELMRELWTAEEYITYTGEHYHYEDIKLYTRPREPIPIHWAAWGPTSCEYAGRYADNLLTVTGPEAIEARILPAFKRGLEKAGRSLADADITVETACHVGNPDELVAEVRERNEFIPVGELDNPDPRAIEEVASERLAELTDEEIIERNTIVQDPEPLIEMLEAYEAAGVDRVIVANQLGDPRETIELFEEAVLPAVT